MNIDSTFASNGLKISPTAHGKQTLKPSRKQKKKRQRTGLFTA
jgi:hypothetical protein